MTLTSGTPKAHEGVPCVTTPQGPHPYCAMSALRLQRTSHACSSRPGSVLRFSSRKSPGFMAVLAQRLHNVLVKNVSSRAMALHLNSGSTTY